MTETTTAVLSVPDVGRWVAELHEQGRHPGTLQLAQWFAFDHLRHPVARQVSMYCAAVAGVMIANLEDGPELTAGLRKLLEAKDCFVRQALSGVRVQ
jgi:hypothetical protein